MTGRSPSVLGSTSGVSGMGKCAARPFQIWAPRLGFSWLAILLLDHGNSLGRFHSKFGLAAGNAAAPRFGLAGIFLARLPLLEAVLCLLVALA